MKNRFTRGQHRSGQKNWIRAFGFIFLSAAGLVSVSARADFATTLNGQLVAFNDSEAQLKQGSLLWRFPLTAVSRADRDTLKKAAGKNQSIQVRVLASRVKYRLKAGSQGWRDYL